MSDESDPAPETVSECPECESTRVSYHVEFELNDGIKETVEVVECEVCEWSLRS